MISSVQIAGRGNEGIYSFEVWTKVINRDTMLNIGAITQWYDLDQHQEMTNPKGDTTFSWLLIDKNGKFTEQVYKEVKDLNFDTE